jgi:Zn-dependent peptidase ImmA (M78 family)/transcriptional regulator with XRE-family HTH domain
MNDVIIPARIKQARIARGLSLAELSIILGVSSQAISQYELGITKPSMAVLMKMIELLDFPFAFFTKPKNPSNPAYSGSAINFRSLKNTAKKLKDAFATRIEWVDEIYHFLKQYIDFPRVDLPKLDNLISSSELDNETIEAVARTVREHWGLDNGPIPNIVSLLQEKGFVVSRFSFKHQKVDAFSQWLNNVPYIILGSDKSAVRSRFDIAHELGHLILHSHVDQESMKKNQILDRLEQEANYFAGAFLLPAESFGSEVMSTSLDYFIISKKRWKVSIQAMIMRCRALDLLSESQVRYLFVQINKRGYRKNEPLDDVIIFEQPYLLKQAIQLLMENNVIVPHALLDEIALNKNEVDDLCCLPESMLVKQAEKPRLALVKEM